MLFLHFELWLYMFVLVSLNEIVLQHCSVCFDECAVNCHLQF